MKINLPSGGADRNIASGWRKLVTAFDYEYETLTEDFLYDAHSALKIENIQTPEILAWAQRKNLIEPAQETGRVRLTAKGRASWRDTRDPI